MLSVSVKNIRIYQPGVYHPGETLTLAPQASQHVGVVLRMKPGQSITLFNGNDLEFMATIASVERKNVSVTIESAQKISRESPKPIHLAQCISKGERMEWVIQKAVELGVASITPILSERAVVRLDPARLTKKLTQWQSIAISACEQSGRNTVPTINPVEPFNQYLPECQSTIKLVLSPKGAKSWRDYDLKNGDITLLIGPEGGFSDAEILLAEQHHFQPLQLGPRVLRTETAAITAISLLQGVCGDL